jgi:3',5'-cyclic AMP phosphodiesterase CpdA
MSVVLHLSDPHFGTEQGAVVDALLHFARGARPDLVVLGGDITQRARRGQFAAAARFVAQLAMPTLSVPGNHDIPLYNVFARLFYPYRSYRRAMGSELLVIGVNSTRPARHKDGEVSAAQIARVAGLLAQARPGQLRLVVAHHPVRARLESDMSNLLIGRERAVPAWVGAGADLILGGHIHLPYLLPLPPENGHAAWAVQAGTATSHRVRAQTPNSVNLITQAQSPACGPCVVERYDYAATAGRFALVERYSLALSR